MRRLWSRGIRGEVRGEHDPHFGDAMGRELEGVDEIGARVASDTVQRSLGTGDHDRAGDIWK